MRRIVAPAIEAYRRYRLARANSRPYKAFRYLALITIAAYLLTICFPHYLFANVTSHGNLTVYSRTPAGPRIHQILDEAEASIQRNWRGRFSGPWGIESAVASGSGE